MTFGIGLAQISVNRGDRVARDEEMSVECCHFAYCCSFRTDTSEQARVTSQGNGFFIKETIKRTRRRLAGSEI